MWLTSMLRQGVADKINQRRISGFAGIEKGIMQQFANHTVNHFCPAFELGIQLNVGTRIRWKAS